MENVICYLEISATLDKNKFYPKHSVEKWVDIEFNGLIDIIKIYLETIGYRDIIIDSDHYIPGTESISSYL